MISGRSVSPGATHLTARLSGAPDTEFTAGARGASGASSASIRSMVTATVSSIVASVSGSPFSSSPSVTLTVTE